MKKMLLLLILSFMNLIALDFQSSGPGGGGSCYYPSINPANENEIFLPCDNSGMFRTTDQGKNWSLYHYSKFRATSQSKVCFTSDPKIMYSINNDFGADLYTTTKTTDGGNTWTSLESDPTFGNTWYIYSDEALTNRIIIASDYDIYISNDGGSNFSLIYEGDILGTGGYIAGVFFNGSSIIVGLPDGLLESTDGGKNFTKTLYQGLGLDEVVFSMVGVKAGNQVGLYCITTTEVFVGMQGYDYPTFVDFYVMNYSMQKGTWISKNAKLPTGANPYYISVAKNMPATIYLAGTNTVTSSPMVLKSLNSGASFVDVFLTKNNQNIITGWAGDGGIVDWTYGEMALGFSCCSTNPSYAVLSDYGFSYITTDGGKSWEKLYNNENTKNLEGDLINKDLSYQTNGMDNMNVWTIAQVYNDYTFPRSMFAGTSDFKLYKINDQYGNFFYNGITENNIYRILSNNTIGDVYYAASSTVRDIYQPSFMDDLKLDAGLGKVYYSTNAGEKWTVLQDFGNPVVWIEMNKKNEREMYASVVDSKDGGIYYSSNINLKEAANWTKLAAPPRTVGHPFNIRILNNGSILCSYSGQRDAQGNFTATSGVFLSKDKGVSWQDISDNAMKYWTKDVIVDSKNDSIIYVAVCSGWNGASVGLGGLYKTTDQGKSWKKILDHDNVESMTIHPINKDRMYVTSGYDGLWVSNNINSSNPTFTEVAEYPFQHPLRVFFGTKVLSNQQSSVTNLYVTSLGNGVRIANNEYVTDVQDEINNTDDISLFPNPSTDFAVIQNNFQNDEIINIKAYSTLGEELFDSGSINLSYGNQFKMDINKLGITSNNFVIFKIITTNNTFYKKMIINK